MKNNDYEMSLNTKLEVAIEILSSMIANAAKSGCDVKSEKMQNLLKERDLLYSGDKKIIDKILNVYGPEIKKNYENK